jgi:hypothetical protein
VHGGLNDAIVPEVFLLVEIACRERTLQVLNDRKSDYKKGAVLKKRRDISYY